MISNWVKGSELQPGDRVLVRLVGLKVKHKLADRWDTNPYIVIEKYDNLPVYVVERENNNNHTRKTLHRNLLMPVGYLNPTAPPSQPTPTQSTRQTRSQIRQRCQLVRFDEKLWDRRWWRWGRLYLVLQVTWRRHYSGQYTVKTPVLN